jgi:Peptidase family C25/LGFP repeat
MTAIDDKYADPQVAAVLGSPTGPEGAALDGGRFRHYQFGSIYYLTGLGAFEVHGAIHAKWASMGWERSVLGYPTTDETGTPDGAGRFNHFQHGSIYWTPWLGAHEVHGPIHDVWSVTGWEAGAGYPTTDALTLPEFAHVEVCFFTNDLIAAPPVDPPQTMLFDSSTGSLLVVAPNNDFVAAAEPFLAHKRSTGMPTFLHVLAADETAGEDAPFRLKGTIAEAASWLNVRYVLLLGDASLIPTRHRCTTDLGAGHLGVAWYSPTDFYYADLYGGDLAAGPYEWRPEVPLGSTPTWIEPESWDANGDDRFNEHHWASDTADFNPDQVQAIPWIAVGRVPAHSPDQAAVYLTKVIAYESAQPAADTRHSILIDYDYSHDASFADTLIERSGKPATQFDIVGQDWPEDVRVPDGILRGQTWATWRAATSSRYLVYIGHGGHAEWDIHNATGAGMIDGPNIDGFHNPNNQPIVMAAGCETSPVMTNAPEAGRYLGIDGDPHDYQWSGSNVVDSAAHPPQAPVAAPVDTVGPSPFDFAGQTSIGFATHWLCNPNGGGIAYFGEQSVAQDNWGVELLGRVLHFLSPGTILGDAWISGQSTYRTDFINDRSVAQNPIGAPRIYLTYMHLFGDPSLRVW